MKVALFYNDDAGAGAAATDIVRAILRHGHQVVHVVEKGEGVEALFGYPADAIVVAGGDGTVASVARAVAGHDIPLAVLPLGTANNIALSLGCDKSMDEVIETWADATRRQADLGIARGPWGERRFVEGVGGGLVARAIAAIDAQPLDDSHPPASRIELAIGGYLNVLPRLTAEPWSLRIDGERVDGEYLLAEVLNIKSIGPNFVVADEADPFDGQFTIALATEKERGDLEAYWQARMAGESPRLQLRTRLASRIVIEVGGDLHLDDALFAWPERGCVELAIERAVLPVLGAAPTR